MLRLMLRRFCLSLVTRPLSRCGRLLCPRLLYPRLLGIVLRLTPLALALCCVAASCGQTALAIMPGVLNDPGNRTLRREIMSFAVSEMCNEIRGRSLPLKLRNADPNIGRFFPTACSVQELDENGNLFVQFLGHGYAWTNVTGRMGFEASAAVEYEQDFLMDGSTMYVYFREKKTQKTAFRVLMLEKAGQASGPASVAGLFGTTVAQATQQIGDGVLAHQLEGGFTVVRESDGAVSFSLGVLEKGAQPPKPFAPGESDWKVLVNDRSELHHGQLDFLGPFQIAEAGEALHLTMNAEGASGIDVLVLPKATGDAWIGTYERQAAVTPPPGAALIDEQVTAAAPAAIGAGSATTAGSTTAAGGQPASTQPTVWRRAVRAPQGFYYVVLDNTAVAGRTAPSSQPHDDRAALVSYAVQLED